MNPITRRVRYFTTINETHGVYHDGENKFTAYPGGGWISSPFSSCGSWRWIAATKLAALLFNVPSTYTDPVHERK